MSSSPPGSTLFGAVLVVALVGGLAYAGVKMSQPVVPAQGGATDTIVPEGVPSAPVTSLDEPMSREQITSEAMPTLLFVRTVGKGHQLIQRVAAGSESVLFTDSDLPAKLVASLGLHEQRMVAIFGTDDGSLELRSVALDGSGRTTTLNSQFGGASGAAFSATAKQVAFTSFNNSERDFGFQLVREQLDGSGRVVIDTDNVGLSLPSWSGTGQQLAYIQGQATPDVGQSVRVATIGGSIETAHTFEPSLVITALAWLDDHSLVYCVEPLGNDKQNSAELSVLDLTSKQSRQLIDLPGKERSLVVSQSGWLALVAGEVSGQESMPAGTLTVLELATGKQQNLGTATGAGAWMQR